MGAQVTLEQSYGRLRPVSTHVSLSTSVSWCARNEPDEAAEADAAVARALELYEQKGNVAALARLRARDPTTRAAQA
jgi:hypothetical protein